MNVGAYNQTMFTRYNRTANNNSRAEVSISFDDEGRRMNHTSFNKDDLMNQFWGMTGNMPKENQISLAASVMATKVFDQGITPETKNFLQNISNRFSPEEIGSLKKEIKNHPAMQNKAKSALDKFLNDFDAFISGQQSTQMENLQKQQANPKFRTPEEIFFQTTFLNKPLIEPSSAIS
ncbi:MAG: hypothetical protein AB1403_02060 [Candidatus Riflebacteria bacterium]